MVKRTKGESVGALLKRWREACGLSQRDAAEAVGASQGRWCKWEIGPERPGPAYLKAIAEQSGGELPLAVLVEACSEAKDGRAA